MIKITPDMPRPILLAIITGRIRAHRALLLEIQARLYKLLTKKVTKKELIFELEMIKQMVDILISNLQKDEEEITRAAKTYA